ncbi:MAG: heavy metal translocating P-type ATPase [Spirochaetaceae bacterium]|nr:heavy metal translocating P-type ATPase [Spirochaetaceae bacterium]
MACQHCESCAETNLNCPVEKEHDEKKFISVKIIRLIITAAAAALGLYLRSTGEPVQALRLPASAQGYFQLLVFFISWLVSSYDVVWSALKNISKGKVFDENFLMTAATLGAFFIGEYPEAVAVMVFYQVGESFQEAAAIRSRRSITALVNIKEPFARRLNGGLEELTASEQVLPGDILLVRTGERFPVDGEIIEGSGFIDLSSLTGESLPVEVKPGTEVLSGAINSSSVLFKIRAVREYKNSQAAKIIDLVEHASANKAKTEKFISSFAAVYTPIVTLSALLLALIPPLVINSGFNGLYESGLLEQWIYRSLVFLVISCPCALVVSVPLGFFGGIGAFSRSGILVKGADFIEVLSRVHTAVFDKTGTLTRGTFSVSMVHPFTGVKSPLSEEELLAVASHVQMHSNHPIARSFKNAHSKDCCSLVTVEQVEEFAGKGIRAVVDGKQVTAGNAELMKSTQVEGFGSEYSCSRCTDAAVCSGTCIHIAVDNVYSGHIVISDVIKDDAQEAVAELKKLGVKRTVLLTGDTQESALPVAQKAGIDTVFSSLLPADKARIVTEIIQDLKIRSGKKRRGSVIFTGDGINDSPVLALSDAGIAMGGLGSDAAVEASDIVIMNDVLLKLPLAIRIARRTLSIVKQNIVFVLCVKAAVMILGALGFAPLALAVFADVGVSLIATLNSVRALSVKK